MTSALEISSLTKTFDARPVVDSVSLDLAPGSLTALLGPSGCGKSTTLHMIAGLIAPDSGTICVAGHEITRMPAEQRPLSLVFQKPLLFPHMTVAQNVGFGLRMRGERRTVRDRRVAQILEQVHLGELGSRRPHELSGGQEQRVALARALVLEPSVLLLDEPFSQLDASLRSEMRHLVAELHRQHAVTTLFVTHDQAEAVEIADDIVLMLDGRVEAHESPQVLYTAPPTLRAARFFSATNELLGTASEGSFHLAGTSVPVSSPDVRGDAVLVVRPEAVTITAAASPHALELTVQSVRFAGTHLLCTGRTADHQLLTWHAPAGESISVGQRVGAELRPQTCTIFPREES